MYLQLASICLFIHTSAGISVASTSSPYTNPVTEPSYASPSTVEPSADYKAPNQYPYSRQFFEPLFTPSNQYAESQTSPSPATGKQFLLHRFPFFSNSNSPYKQQPSPYEQPQQPSPYEQPNYFGQPPHGVSSALGQPPWGVSSAALGQPPWGVSSAALGQPPWGVSSAALGQPPHGVSAAYLNQALYEPQYPWAFPPKTSRNPYLPDCDFHPSSAFRNTKPSLFYPNRPDPSLYRF